MILEKKSYAKLRQVHEFYETFKSQAIFKVFNINTNSLLIITGSGMMLSRPCDSKQFTYDSDTLYAKPPHTAMIHTDELIVCRPID